MPLTGWLPSGWCLSGWGPGWKPAGWKLAAPTPYAAAGRVRGTDAILGDIADILSDSRMRRCFAIARDLTLRQFGGNQKVPGSGLPGRHGIALNRLASRPPARSGGVRERFRRTRAGLRATILLAGATAWPAAAQSLTQIRSLANAASSDAVQQRARPQYDATGIDIGAFRLTPTVRARLAYDDNIFNTSAGRVDDTILTLQPAASLASLWARHALAVAASTSIERYARTGIANAEQYSVRGAGRYDISRAAVLGLTAVRARVVEPRGSLGDTSIGGEPSRYDESSATVTASALLVSVGLTASAGIDDFDYKSVRTNGTTVSQDFRDRRQDNLSLRADVAVGPGLRVFASGAYNRQRYRQRIGIVDQDSHGYTLLGGVSFGLTELVSGEIGLGYISQHYAEPAFGTIAGLGYNARMTWNPTRLTTVTLRADKTIQQSPFISQSGVAQDQVELGIDHELLRNLIVSASASVVRDRYREFGRTDRRYAVDLGARLLLNRNMEVQLNANHRRQDSSGAFARPYRGSNVSVSVLLKR